MGAIRDGFDSNARLERVCLWGALGVTLQGGDEFATEALSDNLISAIKRLTHMLPFVILALAVTGLALLKVVVVPLGAAYLESRRVEYSSIGGLDYSSRALIDGAKLAYAQPLKSIYVFNPSVSTQYELASHHESQIVHPTVIRLQRARNQVFVARRENNLPDSGLGNCWGIVGDFFKHRLARKCYFVFRWHYPAPIFFTDDSRWSVPGNVYLPHYSGHEPVKGYACNRFFRIAVNAGKHPCSVSIHRGFSTQERGRSAIFSGISSYPSVFRLLLEFWQTSPRRVYSPPGYGSENQRHSQARVVEKVALTRWHTNDRYGILMGCGTLALGFILWMIGGCFLWDRRWSIGWTFVGMGILLVAATFVWAVCDDQAHSEYRHDFQHGNTLTLAMEDAHGES